MLEVARLLSFIKLEIRYSSIKGERRDHLASVDLSHDNHLFDMDVLVMKSVASLHLRPPLPRGSEGPSGHEDSPTSFARKPVTRKALKENAKPSFNKDRDWLGNHPRPRGLKFHQVFQWHPIP